jgi:hypothetical protein
LSEVDFFIEHKAGSKIGHVDALSRHVGAVIHGDSLDKEIIFVNKQKTNSILRRSMESIPAYTIL